MVALYDQKHVLTFRKGWSRTAVRKVGLFLKTAPFLRTLYLPRRTTPLKCCRLKLWIGWAMARLESCHRLYIRSRRPHRIILMRHAESDGNVDKGMYSWTPDHALKITERGKIQVKHHCDSRCLLLLLLEAALCVPWWRVSCWRVFSACFDMRSISTLDCLPRSIIWRWLVLLL